MISLSSAVGAKYSGYEGVTTNHEHVHALEGSKNVKTL